MNPLAELKADERREWFWFFILAFFILAAGYGMREPWPSDEPRFVLVAKQMVESGNYLFPHRGIELYPDKPPFFFWLLAACYQAIGSWRWSFLLPSLLSGMAVLYLTWDAGRRLWNPRAGLWAAAAVLFNVQFVYQFKRAQIDPTLVLFTTIALYGFIRHLLLGPSWRWFYAGCFFSGLGIITKGVGFLPLLIFIPYLALRFVKADGLSVQGKSSPWRWSAGLFFFLAAMAIWLVPLLWTVSHGGNAEQQAYLNDILFRQTAKRYANPWGHHEPFWYFGEIVLLFWLPFSLVLFWLWKPWYQALRIRDAKVILPLAWGILVIVFFSLSSGKRDMYILPALPAFALAAAPFMQALSERNRFRYALFALIAFLSLAMLALGLQALVGEPGFEKKFMLERGAALLDPLWWMLVVVGGTSLLASLFFRHKKPLQACLVFFVLLWSGYSFVAYPVLDGANSSKDVMLRARELAGTKTIIGLVDWKEQNLLQAKGETTDFGFLESPATQLQKGVDWLKVSPQKRRLLLQSSKQTQCVDFNSSDAVSLGNANRRSWWLIGEQATAACR
ncbi:MAG TPA: glycosyltransferase family 39 protein [Arenimonas sp.]|nr:glycosyltransferase family 39 protein [Arenimonas sp.]